MPLLFENNEQNRTSLLNDDYFYENIQSDISSATNSLQLCEVDVDEFVDGFKRGYAYPNKGIDAVKTIDDPTYLGFTLLFDWDSSKLFKGYKQVAANGTVSGVLPSTECAFSYLHANGETVRMAYLKAFIEQLKYINDYKPFYWQTIEGLDSLWTDFNDFKKMPIASEWELSIKTLESIDLKIYGLMELYRKAIFDYDHTRQVVPSNLQRFNMTIYINDVRTYRPNPYTVGSNKINYLGNTEGKIDLLAALGLDDVYGAFNFNNIMAQIKANKGDDPVNSTEATDSLVNWLNGDESGIIISYTGCKFYPVGGGALLANVNNSSIEQATNDLVIKAKSAGIASVLAWYSEKVDENTTPSNLRDENLWNQIKNRTKNLLETSVRDIYEKRRRSVRTSVGNLIKDNLPGDILGTIQDLERGNLISALYRATGLGKGLPDVYPEIDGPQTQSRPNNIAKVYEDGLAIQSTAQVNNIGEVYEVNQSSAEITSNSIGKVYSEQDIGENTTIELSENLGTVYPDLQNYLISQRLENQDTEQSIKSLDAYGNENNPNIVSQESDLDRVPENIDVYPNLQEITSEENEIGGKLTVYPNLEEIIEEQNELDPDINVHPNLEQVLANREKLDPPIDVYPFISDTNPPPITPELPVELSNVYPDLQNYLINKRLERDAKESALENNDVYPNLEEILNQRNDFEEAKVFDVQDVVNNDSVDPNIGVYPEI